MPCCIGLFSVLVVKLSKFSVILSCTEYDNDSNEDLTYSNVHNQRLYFCVNEKSGTIQFSQFTLKPILSASCNSVGIFAEKTSTSEWYVYLQHRNVLASSGNDVNDWG